MRINDTSSVPKETLSDSLATPFKTIVCDVGCHAQSTFRGGSENDIQMCANKQRGAVRGLRARETFHSSFPAAVARNTRTCGNDLASLKNGICS